MRHDRSRCRFRHSIALGLSLVGALATGACGGEGVVFLFIINEAGATDIQFSVTGAGANTATSSLGTTVLGTLDDFDYHASVALPEAQEGDEVDITVTQGANSMTTTCTLHITAIDELDAWASINGTTVECLFHFLEYELTL